MIKIKIVCGFRKDQEYTIEAEEAHKAYYIFLNPEKRAVFSSGIAVRGVDIQAIVPDYHATMGWNKAHNLDAYDYQELKEKGIEEKTRDLLYEAKQFATENRDNPALFSIPMSEAKHKLLG